MSSQQYDKLHYDQIKLTVPKGMKTYLRERIKTDGEFKSMREFFIYCIKEFEWEDGVTWRRWKARGTRNKKRRHAARVSRGT